MRRLGSKVRLKAGGDPTLVLPGCWVDSGCEGCLKSCILVGFGLPRNRRLLASFGVVAFSTSTILDRQGQAVTCLAAKTIDW